MHRYKNVTIYETTGPSHNHIDGVGAPYRVPVQQQDQSSVAHVAIGFIVDCLTVWLGIHVHIDHHIHVDIVDDHVGCLDLCQHGQRGSAGGIVELADTSRAAEHRHVHGRSVADLERVDLVG